MRVNNCKKERDASAKLWFCQFNPTAFCRFRCCRCRGCLSSLLIAARQAMISEVLVLPHNYKTYINESLNTKDERITLKVMKFKGIRNNWFKFHWTRNSKLPSITTLDSPRAGNPRQGRFSIEIPLDNANLKFSAINRVAWILDVNFDSVLLPQ